MTCMVKLNVINDVKAFVNHCSSCAFDIDLTSGRYTINAKSIMGIFSLDLSNPIQVVVSEEGPEAEAFFGAIAPFRIDGDAAGAPDGAAS